MTIKKARTEAGLTQKQLSEKIGITQRQLINLERASTCIKLCTLRKIAKACKVKITELI